MLDPIVVGQTRPVWTWEIVQTDNSPQPITGGTFTGKMKKGVAKTMTPGNFSIIDVNKLSYTPVSPDVDTAGRWDIQIDAALGGGVYVIESGILIREHF